MKISQILLLISSLFAFNNAYAQPDMAEGQELHDENCVRCHSSDAYTRSNRRVTNLAKLGTQVRFCKDNLGVSWFNEDVDAVVNYLDKKYYKF